MNTEISNLEVYGKLDVTVPESTYEAGSVSTVAILIRNPFDVPVNIIEVQGPRSSYLSEIQDKSPNIKHQNGEKKRNKKRNIFTSILDFLNESVVITQVGLGGITAEFPSKKNSLNCHIDDGSILEIDTNLSDFDEVNITVDKTSKVVFKPQLIKQKSSERRQQITIEPHCEVVAYFNISTSGWLLFTPTRQSLNTLIKYTINDIEKTQVVTSEFDIRPPLLSMLIGSSIGSILGTLAKILNTAQFFEWKSIIVSLIASIIMSLIATVALSRKSGTQGFITVEDFFGGFVIGALIGYGGESYFENAFLPDSTE
jgi:hypothetical protein